MNKIIVLNSFRLNTPSKQLGDLLLVWCQALRSRDCNLVASPSCGFSRLPFDFDPNLFPPSMTSSLTSCINDFSAVGELLSQGTAGWKIQEYQNMVHTLHAKNSQKNAVLNCSCAVVYRALCAQERRAGNKILVPWRRSEDWFTGADPRAGMVSRK